MAALLQKGNCVSCHGANFDTPLPGYPKLAGQYKDYLYQALKSYQITGNREVLGRQNAIMAGMVKPYTSRRIEDHRRLRRARLPSDLKVAPQSRASS